MLVVYVYIEKREMIYERQQITKQNECAVQQLSDIPIDIVAALNFGLIEINGFYTIQNQNAVYDRPWCIGIRQNSREERSR